MSSVRVRRHGEYEPVNLFKRVDDGIRKRLPKLLAQRFRKTLISNIDANKYGFTLSKAWLGVKRARGWDMRPFIAEGYYKSKISIFVSDNHLVVGFKSTDRHPRTGKTMRDIAVALEFGVADRNIPPRPLWRRTTDEFFKDLETTLKKDFGIACNVRVK